MTQKYCLIIFRYDNGFLLINIHLNRWSFQLTCLLGDSPSHFIPSSQSFAYLPSLGMGGVLMNFKRKVLHIGSASQTPPIQSLQHAFSHTNRCTHTLTHIKKQLQIHSLAYLDRMINKESQSSDHLTAASRRGVSK